MKINNARILYIYINIVDSPKCHPLLKKERNFLPIFEMTLLYRKKYSVKFLSFNMPTLSTVLKNEQKQTFLVPSDPVRRTIFYLPFTPVEKNVISAH